MINNTLKNKAMLTHLPKEIKSNGKTFVYFGSCSDIHDKPAKGVKYRVISVLARNLRGRTDLHGNLYKPSKWYFVETN